MSQQKHNMWCRGSIHQNKQSGGKKTGPIKLFFYRILKDLMNTLHTR